MPFRADKTHHKQLLPSNGVISASNGSKCCLATVASEEYTRENYGCFCIITLNFPGAWNSVIKGVKLLGYFTALFGSGPTTPFQTIPGQISRTSREQGQLPKGIFILCWEPKECSSGDGGHPAPHSPTPQSTELANISIKNLKSQNILSGDLCFYNTWYA